MTPLHYLGEVESLAQAQDARRAADAEFAFAWGWLKYDGGPPERVMLAWVPSVAGSEFAIWPVYEKTRPEGDRTYWRWDGDLAEPTLHPSLCLTVKGKQIAHGFVTRGHWDPC